MNLSSVLPDYYEDNETMQELQWILSDETDKLEKSLSKAMNDVFWSKAAGNEMLTRYERMFGLFPDVGKSDRYRKERIMARVAGAGTTTASLVQHIAESYTNATVELKENFPEYTVTVRFVGTSGIPGNISDIKESIEEMIPAHLKVLYEYIFNTYGSVGTFTHKQLAEYNQMECQTALSILLVMWPLVWQYQL